MRVTCFLLLMLPYFSMAQHADTLHRKPALKEVAEVYTEIGFMTEQWSLANKNPHYYSAVDYSGGGFFIGGGVKTRTNARRPFGFGIALNYVDYKISGALTINENVSNVFYFLRAAPSIYYEMQTKSGVTILSSVNFGLLFHLNSDQANYSQVGLRSGVEYKAYGLNVGYNFTQSSSSPAVNIETGLWKEKMVSLDFVVYPFRIYQKPGNPLPVQSGKK